MRCLSWAAALLAVAALLGPLAAVAASPAAAGNAPSAAAGYTIKPGDTLEISVWKEQNLQREVLVRPDGGLSFPLVGNLQAQGKTVPELQKELTDRLQQYIPDPAVTVAVKQVGGNVVYVIGKVNHPGAFVANQPLDVMQALAIAGGMTTFASVNDIKILRRENGKETAIRFEYGDVAKGEDLRQNIVLRAGDVVVVP